MASSAPPPSSDPLKKSKRSPLIAINTRSESDRSDSSSSKLDSSLKRHTSLLNRLRKQFTLEAREAILKDVEGLTLEKYAEEIVGACVEGIAGLGAKGDVFGVVEILTALSSRLPHLTFLIPLFTQLLAFLSPPNVAALKALPAESRDREEKERITKQRGVLRVLAEAEACGLRLPAGSSAAAGGGKKVSKSAAAAAAAAVEPNGGVSASGGWCVEDGMRGLLTSDPLYTSLPLFTSFLKSFGRLYLGPNASPSSDLPSSEDPLPGESRPASEEELVPLDVQKRLKGLFEAYYEGLGKVVIKGRVKLQQQDLKNHEAYIKSGEIFEDRQQAYEKMTREVERLMAGMVSLADLLHFPPPVFPSLATSKGHSSVINLDASAANPFARSLEDIPVGGMWEDEEERRFYEDVVDLGEFVPGAILGVKQVEKGEDGGVKEKKENGIGPEGDDGEEEREKEKKEAEDVKRQLEKMDENGTAAEVDTVEEKKQDEVDPGVGDQTEIPASLLPETTSKSALDQLAVDFAILNSKPSRKRIVKFLGAVPKNRSDLLPLYARFAATLNPYMPDVGKGLIEILDEEFRYLQRKKLVKELAEVRSKNIRFYCELAKFKVAQPHSILHVYKVLIDDLTGSNVECAALLLEGCGRFLLRSEHTGERMKSMLELMRRKQNAQHFDQRLLLLLENAYYQCNPPERTAVQQKERTPMELFVRHLIHDILIKKTVDKVLKLLRKLHWKDPVVYKLLHKTFTKVWALKFSNIGALAILVYELARWQSDFATGVVDQVLEDIRAGLETNIFKHNQRRIASVKYLGELHYYRQVNSPVIFDTLWSLITFGHSEPLPVPGRACENDAADDFFRVRLICTLLDTCGMCFDKGSTKKKLDQFLVVFQLYIMCKKDCPMDVEFMVADTFETVRPDMVPYKTFEQVGAAVDDLLAAQALSSVATGGQESDGEESEDGDEEHRAELEPGEEVLEAGVEVDAEGEENVDGAEDDDDSSSTSSSSNASLSPDGAEPTTEPEPEDDLVLQRLARAEAQAREEDEEFNREFAKMMSEQSDAKKGDRKANVPIFDTAVPLMRRAQKGKAGGEDEVGGVGAATAVEDLSVTRFMLLTKKGNKPQTRMMDIPFDSPIAVNTRTNQMQDKLEQQQTKMLVLNHQMRQEDNEKKNMEALAKARGIRLRFVDK